MKVFEGNGFPGNPIWFVSKSMNDWGWRIIVWNGKPREAVHTKINEGHEQYTERDVIPKAIAECLPMHVIVELKTVGMKFV